jgi:hypothetical protein
MRRMECWVSWRVRWQGKRGALVKGEAHAFLKARFHLFYEMFPLSNKKGASLLGKHEV